VKNAVLDKSIESAISGLFGAAVEFAMNRYLEPKFWKSYPAKE